MMDIIRGYKAFNKDMTNRYGQTFEEGKNYSVVGPLIYGNKGNGFHFCKRLEDTLRYFPALKEEIKIAQVETKNEVQENWDDYYGYYDMYVARTLTIDKILTREEIISMFLDLYDERVVRFLAGYRLTEKEIEIFRLKYPSSRKIQLAISYYQENDKEAYSRACEKDKLIQKSKNKFS